MKHIKLASYTDNQLSKKFKTMNLSTLDWEYNDFDEEDKKRFLKVLPESILPNFFLYSDSKDEILELVPDLKKTKILNNIRTDKLKDYIQSSLDDFNIEDEDEKEVYEGRKNKLFSYLTFSKRKSIESLLKYGEDIAASLMSTDFIVINSEDTVKGALNKIIKESKPTDYIDNVFINDSSDSVIGNVSLKTLITSQPDELVLSIKEEKYYFVNQNAPTEDAIQIVRNHTLDSLAVLDGNKIVGIITENDILEEIAERTEENLDITRSLSSDENEPVFRRIKKRIPILILNIVLSLILGFALSGFEDTIATVIALALFQPMILDFAGNVSTQSTGVTIIKLHNRNLYGKPLPHRFLLSELIMGLITGTMVVIVAFFMVFLFLTIMPFGTSNPLSIATVVSLSMFGSLVVAAFVGSAIPLLAAKYKIDPAVVSGPLVTTINDITSSFIYFGLATLILMIK